MASACRQKCKEGLLLTGLFGELEEKYRCDAPNIVGDEEDALFDEFLDASLVVRCGAVCLA